MSSPKIKAKELVEKFDGVRQYAIFCVDEILVYYPVAVNDERSKSFNEYWQSVRTEIQNL